MTYACHDEVIMDVKKYIEENIGKNHPVPWLRERLKTKEQKINLGKLIMPKMVAVNPGMGSFVTKWVSADRATQDSGDAGHAHALMLSYETVMGTTMDAFQRGMAPPAKIYDVLFRSLEEGLDTSARPIVLAIGRRMCEAEITNKVFFAG